MGRAPSGTPSLRHSFDWLAELWRIRRSVIQFGVGSVATANAAGVRINVLTTTVPFASQLAREWPSISASQFDLTVSRRRSRATTICRSRCTFSRVASAYYLSASLPRRMVARVRFTGARLKLKWNAGGGARSDEFTPTIRGTRVAFARRVANVNRCLLSPYDPSGVVTTRAERQMRSAGVVIGLFVVLAVAPAGAADTVLLTQKGPPRATVRGSVLAYSEYDAASRLFRLAVRHGNKVRHVRGAVRKRPFDAALGTDRRGRVVITAAKQGRRKLRVWRHGGRRARCGRNTWTRPGHGRRVSRWTGTQAPGPLLDHPSRLRPLSTAAVRARVRHEVRNHPSWTGERRTEAAIGSSPGHKARRINTPKDTRHRGGACARCAQPAPALESSVRLLSLLSDQSSRLRSAPAAQAVPARCACTP